MKITYVALKPLRIGDDVREPGELVPEASDWKQLDLYLGSNKLAAVLVCTLPREMQTDLEAWEEALVESELSVIEEMKRQDMYGDEFIGRPNVNDPVAMWRQWADQFFDDVDDLNKAELIRLNPEEAEDNG